MSLEQRVAVDERVDVCLDNRAIPNPSPGRTPESPSPVDDFFPASAVGGTIVGKDTTSESTPEQRCANTARGPRRPKGHDRLMDKVQPPSDTAPAVCPTCGDSPVARSARTSGGVNIGDYRCSAGHIWSTHWPAVA